MEMGRDPDYGPLRCDCCSSKDGTKLVILPDCSGKVMCGGCRDKLRAELKKLG